MKYHKIRNVPMEVCTAEQMIAYNMAFRADISFGDKFRKLPTAAAKSEAVVKIRDLQLKAFRQAYDYKPGRYDEDAIFCALNAGLKNYLEKPFIAWTYEPIGKAFPAHYLNK